jgi:SAM-dependent methyltransferase
VAHSGHIHPDRAGHLNDPRRLESQLTEHDLARLLALGGNEDVLDLGGGTGFYTDRIAALTTGTVYALELQPEMIDHYRQRGVPANVRLVLGDMTALRVETADAAAAPGSTVIQTALRPASVDVVCTIATWHEVEGRLDLPGLARVVRPGGRLVVIDWRKDPESPESGPPLDIRVTKAEVAGSLAPYFAVTAAEDLGRYMFAVTAERVAG